MKYSYKAYLPSTTFLFLSFILFTPLKTFAQRKDSAAVHQIKPAMQTSSLAQPNVVSGSNLSGQNFINTGGWLQSGDYGGFRLLGEQGNTPARPSFGFYSTDGVNDGAGGMGIYRPEANGMAFSTASTERMILKPNGFLGIGTSYPGYRLDVNGEINATGFRVNGVPLTTSGGSSQWVTNSNNISYSTGNVGIGTTTPGAKLSLGDVNNGTNLPDGITWYSPAPLNYGIYRTSGGWSSPDYQQLKLSWNTGIILDPGTSYGRSFVDIQGAGLRVTSGNVGIGTTAPAYKLDVNGDINATGFKLNGVPLSAGGINGPIPSLEVIGAPWFHLKNSGANGEVLRLGEAFDVPSFPTVSFFVHDAGGSSYLDYKLNRYAGNFTWKRNSASGEKVISLMTGNDSGNTFDIYNGSNSATSIHLSSNGVSYLNGTSIGIGTTNPGSFALAVEGKLGARSVQITSISPWPDFVFKANYNLRSLAEVEKYIYENGHLPDVPTEEEVSKEGIDVAKTNAMLLQKIEELTLYMIQMKKENEELKNKVEKISLNIK